MCVCVLWMGEWMGGWARERGVSLSLFALNSTLRSEGRCVCVCVLWVGGWVGG